MRIVVITFATPEFRNPAILQSWFCKIMGINHHIFTPDDLASDIKTYCDANPRGYGYWSWKPYIIKKAFQIHGNTSCVFYLDSTLLPTSKFFTLKLSSPYIPTNLFSNPRDWTKPLSISKDELTSFLTQGLIPDASHLYFSRCYSSQNLLTQWDKLCSAHSLISDDTFMSTPFVYPYIEHRHDQSLLGLACYRCGLSTSPSLTQYGSTKPFLFHHRERLSSLKSIFRFIISASVFYLKYFLNSPFVFVRLRQRSLKVES